MFSGHSEDIVIGVVYEIHDLEKPELDRIEERGYGYEEKTVYANAFHGEKIEVMTYYAKNIDSTLKPYHWYKEHVLFGARENNLPTTYIQAIEQVESIEDPKPERHAHELQVYW